MNTVIVWVMMAYTGHTYIPTLEFKTQIKCETAANKIKMNFDDGSAWGKLQKPYCVEIEK